MNDEKLQKLISVAAQHRKNGLREGQSLMNALWEVSPETYAVVKGTLEDCFYDDSLIPRFWEFLQKEIKE